jgi:LysR family pca operon transcriptional activator
MELIDLRLFQRVAQEGSISRAAAGLQLAQSAVSQRLQALETAVGRPLLQRHRRGVHLTAEGQRLLMYVERTLATLAEGMEAVRSMAPERARINLAGPASLLGYFAVPLLERLVGEGHDLHVQDAHSHQVIQLLLSGEIHLGFVLGANAQPGICQEPIAREPIVAVAAPSHPLAGRVGLDLADLKGHALVFYAFSRAMEEFRTTLEEAIGAPVQGVRRVSPVEAARALALSGAFITFVPRLTVQAELKAGRLTTLPIRDLPAYHWEIALAYRERKVQEPAVSLALQAARALWGPPAGPNPRSGAPR